MKQFKGIVLLCLLFILPTQISKTENVAIPDKEHVLMDLIFQGLSANHYKSVTLNDEYSNHAFDMYIKRTDYNKRFFLNEDIEKLNVYRNKVDDLVKDKSYELFELSIDIMDKRIQQVKTFYPDILKKPFDFERQEFIELDADKKDFANNIKELKERWRKSLKYQTLRKLHTDLEQQEKSEVDSIKNKSFKEMEADAREYVRKSQENFFEQLEKLERQDRVSVYINSLISIYDPHTNYFPPKDKENFDIAISGRLEGIGAQLNQKDGFIKVSRIVPGSASWRQGELEVGDIILKVAQADDEPVDVVDMRLDKAVQLIRGKKGTEVRLTVQKLDGEIKIISIIRDIVVLKETYARSAILQEEGVDEKLGYIKLPKFYTDFTKTGGRTSSDDVANEIEKLKKENIDGLILDLRNNGGGSLQDVVKMVGLFIETGPIVQVKARAGAPYIFEDNDPEIQYNGPLLVMVNPLSASASEILAAAIQDYNRGVIIGAKETHGKGTVQQFVNLDRFLSGDLSEIKPLGSIKLTTQKFYRIDGRSTQLRGVQPDIILPHVYSYIDIGEKEFDYALGWDEIEALDFNKSPQSNFDIKDLQKSSSKRTKHNTTFNLIEENAQRLKAQNEETLYPIDLKGYQEHQQERKEKSEKFKDINKTPIPGLNASVLANTDSLEIANDSSEITRLNIFTEDLEKDAYIYETICIARQMIN
ncbi:MAG: carboxy terminal-processing peptidase [Chitinophagales bacterium]